MHATLASFVVLSLQLVVPASPQDPAAGHSIVWSTGPIRFRHAGRIDRVQFAPDGKHIVAVSERPVKLNRPGRSIPKTIRVWTYPAGRLVHDSAGTIGGFLTLGADAGKAFVADFKSLRILDVGTGAAREIKLPRVGSKIWRTGAVSPDGRHYARTNGQSTNLFDLVTGSVVTLKLKQQSRVRALAFVRGGKFLAVGDSIGMITIFRTDRGSEVHSKLSGKVTLRFPYPKRSPVTAVAAWRDDACLVGHADQAMRIWSVSKAGRLERGRRIVFDAHPSAVCGNAELLVTGLETGEVQVSAARGRKTGLVIAAHGATGLDLSPDGTVLATVGFDNSIAFFDTKSGVQLHRDEQPRRGIEQIALHPDGKSLILNELVRGHIPPAELPHLVALRGFTLDPNKQTWTVRGFNVGDLAIAPGGQIAARVQRKRSGMTPALVVGFDPHTGKKIWENRRGVCSRLAFTLDGKGIFGAGDRTTSRRTAGDGETVWIQRVTGRAHLSPTTIAPDGKTVAVVCGKAVEIRKIDDGALLRSLPGGHAVVFFGGGERAVIGGNGRMRVIEYHTGRVKSLWRMEDRVDLQTAMTPVGLVAGDSKLLWYAGSWRKDRLFVTDLAKKRTTLIREDPRMSSFALSPDRRHLAIGYLDCRAELHDVAALIAVAEKRGKVVNVVADTGPSLAPILGRLKHASAVRSIAVQPGSGHVACGQELQRVVLWNPNTKKRVEELTGRLGRRLAWSDDGRWLAHGSSSAITLTDRKLGEQVVLAKRTRAFLFAPGSGSVSYGDAGKWQRYNLSSGETRTVVEIPDPPIRSAAVSLDGSRVALVGAKGGIWLFARKNEQLTKLVSFPRLGFAAGDPTHVEFQPGNAAGTTLMYQHGSSILLYKDLEKSKSPTGLGPSNVSASTFTPDGERIVIGYLDGHVAVVDTDRGRVLRKWPAHRGTVYALAFDPEKKAMYSAGAEGFVLIWDATAMLAK